MLGLTTAGIARSLAATLRGAGDRRVGRVAADSRRLGPGDLFVALPGARSDGHEFLREAQRLGAAAALVQPDRGLRPPGLPVIIVPDTLTALADLARLHLGRLGVQVIGITGSAGKTTAKDFLSQLLGGQEAGVHAAPASYNSEIGLPLAILAADQGTQRMVLEYGVNAPGEMQQLLRIARPRHAWITSLGHTHLEGLGDFSTVVAEKSRLARAVPDGGRVWIPSDLVEHLADRAQTWRARVVVSELPGRRILARRPGSWRLELPRIGEVQIPVVARHEAQLAATAARAALDLGVAPALVAERLARLVRPVGRLTPHRFGPVTVVDDSYNASPPAMRAALEVLDGWPGSGRRIAVLGTMHELGASSERLHRELGQLLAQGKADLVLAVGRGGAWIAESAAAAGTRAELQVVDDAAAAAATLARRLQPGDMVLLKASRAEGLDVMLPGLRAAAEALPGARLAWEGGPGERRAGGNAA